MKKSFSQLKRDLVVGNKLKCLEHNIRPEKVGNVNEIVKKNSNSVSTLQNGKAVWLPYPDSANLVEYEDNIFRFYEAGYREITEEEKRHVEKMNTLINNSYNNPYYIKQQYGKEHNCEYLTGHEIVKGKKFDLNKYRRNEPCILDNSIKGEMLYSFEIVA